MREIFIDRIKTEIHQYHCFAKYNYIGFPLPLSQQKRFFGKQNKGKINGGNYEIDLNSQCNVGIRSPYVHGIF